MHPKYSILMPYYERAGLLYNTLVSYQHWYADRNDFEIVLVEDRKGSEEDHAKLQSVLKIFANFAFKHIEIEGNGHNPASLYNIAFSASSGAFCVLTNPECYHVSDVLGGFDKYLCENDNRYVICACANHKNVLEFSPKYSSTFGNFDRWYQHSEFRNAQYHFCSAMSRVSYAEMNGFDERFSEGYCYDDDDFRETVKAFGLEMIQADELQVIHQAHKKQKMTTHMKALLEKNRRLYEFKWHHRR